MFLRKTLLTSVFSTQHQAPARDVFVATRGFHNAQLSLARHLIAWFPGTTFNLGSRTIIVFRGGKQNRDWRLHLSSGCQSEIPQSLQESFPDNSATDEEQQRVPGSSLQL